MGIDKSIRMRIKVDVCKLLSKHVKVKMRGGVVEDYFDVKYEKPPPFCFFYGRLGHGVKDCHECRDKEDQAMEFGGWLKASPWKRTILNEDNVGKNKQMKCAKPLFITKPKSIDVHATFKQVDEVINHLHSCDISETIQVEQTKTRAEGQGTKGGSSMVESRGAQLGGEEGCTLAIEEGGESRFYKKLKLERE